MHCTFCSNVVGTKEIMSAMQRITLPTFTSLVPVTCPHCFTKFSHIPKYANGDPRNLALIAHWDGWQPFATSIKHSCGECVIASYMSMLCDTIKFFAIIFATL